MAATLEFLGNFQSFAISAAQTGDDEAIGAPKKRQQNGVSGCLLLEQLVHDQIIVADDCIDKTNRGADLGDVFFAPGQPERVLDAALDLHYLEQRMIQQLLNLSAQ